MSITFSIISFLESTLQAILLLTSSTEQAVQTSPQVPFPNFLFIQMAYFLSIIFVFESDIIYTVLDLMIDIFIYNEMNKLIVSDQMKINILNFHKWDQKYILNNYIYIAIMMNMLDLEKFRTSRNISHQYSATQRFSQPNHQDIYNINYDKVQDQQFKNTYPTKFYETYNKYIGSRELLQNNNEKKIVHKRGFSNIVPFTEKKDLEIISPGLSIYNMSMRTTQKAPNPLTARRQKPEQMQFEIMPENQFRENKIKGSIVKQEKLNKAGFNLIYPIGKGGFGKVWKVQNKKTNEVLAMKEMYKAKIIQKKSINSVLNERTLLAKLKHPFIINMTAAFQDRQNLYLLMDYIDGGDLRYHIGKRRRFNQKETKFFLANMIIGLEYLHKNRIIHRDMKPENLVFDSEGYLRITDLGISRQIREDNHQDTSGTPGYMSPEVICRKNHSYPADYFALGVMGYEFMLGRRPYLGKNRKQIRDQILAKQAAVKVQQLPINWSPEAADFINKLLIRNPNNRLGSNGIQQIKNHPWMINLDWKRLGRKEIAAPYVPLSIQQNYDDYKDQISQDSVDQNFEQNLLVLRNNEVQALFQDYYFDRSNSELKKKLSYTTTNSSNSYNNSNYC